MQIIKLNAIDSTNHYLADLVSSGRLRENEAHELAYDLAYGLAKSAYKL